MATINHRFFLLFVFPYFLPNKAISFTKAPSSLGGGGRATYQKMPVSPLPPTGSFENRGLHPIVPFFFFSIANTIQITWLHVTISSYGPLASLWKNLGSFWHLEKVILTVCFFLFTFGNIHPSTTHVCLV